VSCVSSVCERKCERAMAYGAVATNFSTISFFVSFNPPFDLFFFGHTAEESTHYNHVPPATASGEYNHYQDPNFCQAPGI
jgi:hypothetical protein